MSLQCKEYLLDDKSTVFKCWFFETMGEVWLKGSDIASFLNYAKPDQAVRNNVPTKWTKTFGALIADCKSTPHYDWRDGTIFITELGAYALLSRRTKETEFINFTEWLRAEIYKMKLPTESTTSSRQEYEQKLMGCYTERARCDAEKARCDAEKARFDAEISRLNSLILSHRFVTTIQDITKSSAASIEGTLEDDFATQDFVDTTLDPTTQHGPIDLTQSTLASTLEHKHQYETIDSVAQCPEQQQEQQREQLDDDFAQRSAANFEWANDTLKRLYEQDPTSLTIVKKQKITE